MILNFSDLIDVIYYYYKIPSTDFTQQSNWVHFIYKKYTH